MNTINNNNVTLNSEQQNALKAMLEGMNCFLTGEAGTGKSTEYAEKIKLMIAEWRAEEKYSA